jgi:hypothetical protein
MISIDILPDDVLLEIFDFYVNENLEDRFLQTTDGGMANTCARMSASTQRWRRVVFGSPRRLKLRLVCSPETPARDTLDVWPPLPIYIGSNAVGDDETEEGAGDISAVLERSDRVVRVHLFFLNYLELENTLAEMQVPLAFQELTQSSSNTFDTDTSSLCP